jgi:hypothetical protein
VTPVPTARRSRSSCIELIDAGDRIRDGEYGKPDLRLVRYA